jgi:nucleoside-diphosphate-sugar epimerase
MSNNQYTIVTGANGYLGSYICQELINQGNKVIGFTWNHYASVRIDHPDIEYIRCDIRKEILHQVKDIVEGKEILTVINAAALLGSSDYEKNYLVNAKGVENLVDFARQAGIRRFIQISSVVVLKVFKGPYGETKLIGQQLVEKSGLNFTVFIPAMILGPEGLGINRILKNVFRFPLFVPLIGKGSQTQHPIFVKDFARYIVRSIPEKKASGKVYQIAGDQVISFRDLIRLILKIKGEKRIFVSVPPYIARTMGRIFQKTQKVPLFTAEHVKGVMQDSCLDTSRIREDLGTSFTMLDEALRFTLQEIGRDWDSRLKPRNEKVISLKTI